MMRAVFFLAVLAGCTSERDLDPWDTAGEFYNVQERVAFTTEPYGLTGTGTTIGDLKRDLFPTEGELLFGTDDAYGSANCEDVGTTSKLPVEVEGVVTLHPRWYMKLSGCDRADEKYYGNYFIEDDSGGLFVVGDSKVAHFDVGDRVRMRIRAVRTNFDFDMVYAHDIVEVYRDSRPIKYESIDRALEASDIGEVRRVQGEIVTDPDTFGQFGVRLASGAEVFVNLDAELSRRRQNPDLGDTICATGPVQYSYSEYSIVVMKIGQIAVLGEGETCPDQ